MDYKMGTFTAIAYNPSLTPISGTTQVGDLAIGTTPQAYCDSPGGVTFWMSPDQDPGYVIAYPVPTGNRQTPVGNVGTVRFWRTTAKTDNDFVNLVKYLSSEFGGSAITNVSTATSWLSSAGFWTSYTVADQIRAQLTPAQQTTYDSTAVGNWIKVTATQYNNIVNNVAGATKKGNSDLQVSTRDVLTGYTVPVTFGSGATASFTIDTNEYVIAMISEAWNQPTGVTQLSYTTAFKGPNIINIGGTAGLSTGGTRDYFVRKAPNDPATETRYPVMRMTVSPNAVNNWPGFYTNDNGANWLVGANGAIPKIQIVTTATKSW